MLHLNVVGNVDTFTVKWEGDDPLTPASFSVEPEHLAEPLRSALEGTQDVFGRFISDERVSPEGVRLYLLGYGYTVVPSTGYDELLSQALREEEERNQELVDGDSQAIY